MMTVATLMAMQCNALIHQPAPVLIANGIPWQFSMQLTQMMAMMEIEVMTD